MTFASTHDPQIRLRLPAEDARNAKPSRDAGVGSLFASLPSVRKIFSSLRALTRVWAAAGQRSAGAVATATAPAEVLTRFQPFARALAQATKVRKTEPNEVFLEAVPQAWSTGPDETARNVFFGGSNADVSSPKTEAKELN